MKPAPPVMTTFERDIRVDTTRGAYSRFLRTPKVREEGRHRPRPVGVAVLLRHRHLREGLRRSLGDENRIKSEATRSPFAGRDRPLALPMEDVVRLSLPKEEGRLEPRGPRLRIGQEFQDTRIPEALVHVGGIYAGKPAERIEEEPRVIDQVVALNLVVEDRGGETDDLLEPVRLDLRIASIFVDHFHARVGEHRSHFAVLAFVRRDETDHV